MGYSIQCNNLTLLVGPPASGGGIDHLMTTNTAGAVAYWKCAGGAQTLYPVGSAFDPATLDPVLIAGAVGAGFFLLIPLWAAIFGAKKLVDAIR